MDRRVNDLTGKRFGRLLVTKLTDKRKGDSVVWECQCDCGNTHFVRSKSLLQNRTKSCGCLQKEIQKSSNKTGRAGNNPVFDPKSGVVSLYWHYQNSAKTRRELDFDLSFEDFETLTSSPCYYCGVAPSQKLFRKNYLYNGIDRVNNSLGYSKENCVPCCGTCNRMKGVLGESEFIQQVTRIYTWKGGE